MRRVRQERLRLRVGAGLLRVLAAGTEPGGEIVGTVVAAGPGATGFEVGDRVGGVVFQDAFADLVLADPCLVTPVPAGVGAGAALALVRGGLIALSALRAGHFDRGESVLVTAAASGVGHLAVQLARALGEAVGLVATRANLGRVVLRAG